MSDITNIVNTPIVMYVKEHTLELDGGASLELMEFNSYPVKIYSNENLDGCKLVKKLQNDQALVDANGPDHSDLIRDVKLLLRSKKDDKESIAKAWWVYLENLNDPRTIEGVGVKKIYGGTVKIYDYEYLSTVLKDVERRAEFKVVDLGQLEIYFTNEKDFTGINIVTNPTKNAEDDEIKITDEDFEDNSILTTDFQDIPEPLSQQLSLEIPKTLKINNLKLGKPGTSFNLTNDIIVDTLELERTSYDEETGLYYYQVYKELEGTFSAKTVSSATDTEDVSVKCELDVVCKVNENNFNDYVIEINIILTPELVVRELTSGDIKDKISFGVTDVKINYDNETMEPSVTFPKLNITIDSNEFINPNSIISLEEINLQKGEVKDSITEYICEIDYNGEKYTKGDSEAEIDKRFNFKTTFNISVDNLLLTPPIIEDPNTTETIYDLDEFGNFKTREFSLQNEDLDITKGTIEEILGEYESLRNETVISTFKENDIIVSYGEYSFIEEDFSLEDVLSLETADDYNNVYTLGSDFVVNGYAGAGLNEFVLGLKKDGEDGKIDYITNAVRFTISPSIASEKWLIQDPSEKFFYYAKPTEIVEGIIKKFEYETTVNEGSASSYIKTEVPKELKSVCVNIETLGEDSIDLYTWDVSSGSFKKVGFIGNKTHQQTTTTTT